MPYVAESLIIQESDHKLAALIYPDFEDAYKQGLTDGDIERVMDENRTALNAELPAYSQIARVKIYPEDLKRRLKRVSSVSSTKNKEQKNDTIFESDRIVSVGRIPADRNNLF